MTRRGPGHKRGLLHSMHRPSYADLHALQCTSFCTAPNHATAACPCSQVRPTHPVCIKRPGSSSRFAPRPTSTFTSHYTHAYCLDTDCHCSTRDPASATCTRGHRTMLVPGLFISRACHKATHRGLTLVAPFPGFSADHVPSPTSRVGPSPTAT